MSRSAAGEPTWPAPTRRPTTAGHRTAGARRRGDAGALRRGQRRPGTAPVGRDRLGARPLPARVAARRAGQCGGNGRQLAAACAAHRAAVGAARCPMPSTAPPWPTPANVLGDGLSVSADTLVAAPVPADGRLRQQMVFNVHLRNPEPARTPAMRHARPFAAAPAWASRWSSCSCCSSSSPCSASAARNDVRRSARPATTATTRSPGRPPAAR